MLGSIYWGPPVVGNHQLAIPLPSVLRIPIMIRIKGRVTHYDTSHFVFHYPYLTPSCCTLRFVGLRDLRAQFFRSGQDAGSGEEQRE